jgi:hypothetical protein
MTDTHLTNTRMTDAHADNAGSTRTHSRWLWLMIGLHMLVPTLATVQRLARGGKINNFLIFRSSYYHLISDVDLYAAYPAEHWDFYKYSPTWAMLFAPFAALPIPAGLLLWNLLNAASLAVVIGLLLPARAAAWALLIVFFEALGATQNAQSNGLAAALMIGALIAAERSRLGVGGWAIAAGTSIKLFPISAGIFGLLSPARVKHVLWCMVTGTTLLALPLLVTPLDTLIAQYRSWGAISARDTLSIGQMWIGGIVETYRGALVPHAPIQAFGLVWVLGATWYAARAWHEPVVRRLLLATLLGFATIFNHKGESPTYVIAFAGIGVWWSVLPRARWRDALVLLAFVVGSLGGTELVPRAYRTAYHQGWQLKALTSTLAWIGVQWDLWQAVRRAATGRGERLPDPR